MPQGTQRLNMALGQLYTNQILDANLLGVLTTTPRDAFVPARLARAAYVDAVLDFGNGRSLMEPLAFARLLEMADINPTDKVLDIACGYGYSTVVLGQLSMHVTALDSIPECTGETSSRLKKYGFGSIHVEQGPLDAGYAQAAPYDVIFINGGIQQVPDALARQLAEGGRLLAVQYFAPRPGLAREVGRLVQYRKIEGTLQIKESFEAAAPLLEEFRRPSTFSL